MSRVKLSPIGQTRSFRAAAEGWFRGGALLTTLFSASCGSVYLHDPEFASSTAAAHAEATAKPFESVFDQQLVAMAAGNRAEDVAVANYLTAVRDVQLSEVTASDDPSRRREVLQRKIDGRLRGLIGPRRLDANEEERLLQLPQRVIEHAGRLRNLETTVSADRSRYAGDNPTGRRDLSCQGLLSAGPGSHPDLQRIHRNCADLEKRRQRGSPLIVTLDTFEGTKAAVEDWRETDAAVIPSAATAADLERLIEQVEKNPPRSAAAVERLRAALASLLERAAPATEAAGWDRINKEIDRALRAEVCNRPAAQVEQALLASARCGEIAPTSTEAKVQAAWGLALAVGRVADAYADDGRRAHWLIAAKAIVKARSDDAKLRTTQVKAVSDVRFERLMALAEEARMLVRADQQLRNRQSECREMRGDCALAYYAASWNRGKIPSWVLAFREDQLSREYALRRARTVAVKQQALISAGTGSLDAKAKGGLKAGELADALVGLGLISVGAK